MKEITHESGRGAPVAKVQFQNAYRFKRDNETFVCVEGLYSGQFIYAGKKGTRLRISSHLLIIYVDCIHAITLAWIICMSGYLTGVVIVMCSGSRPHRGQRAPSEPNPRGYRDLQRGGQAR